MLDRVDPRLGSDAHALGAVRMRRDAYAGAMRFLDGRARLLGRVRRELGPGALAQHAAGGEQLDDGRADRDLFACRARAPRPAPSAIRPTSMP